MTVARILSLTPGESLWVPVLSGSMAPVYLPEDEVRVEAVGKDNIRASIEQGQVAVFYESGRFYFHRIIRIKPKVNKVYQKGDANSEGYWIGFERIIGIVREGRRKDDSGFLYYRDPGPGSCSALYRRVVVLRWKNALKRIIKICVHKI